MTSRLRRAHKNMRQISAPTEGAAQSESEFLRSGTTCNPRLHKRTPCIDHFARAKRQQPKTREAPLKSGFVLIAALAFTGASAPAKGQSADAFFNDRQVRIVVGADAGGGYDTYARVVARFLGAHMPGKVTFVVQNMPGAGSVVAMTHLFNRAEKDGSVIGSINPGSVVEPLLKPETVQYDSRAFGWIFSLMRDTEAILASATAPVKKLDDVFTREFLVGSTGGASAASTLPRLINEVLGTKLKVIEGYKGANEILLAVERGEVEGYGSASWSGVKAAESIRTKKIIPIGQYGLEPHADLAGVARAIDFAKTDEQRAMLKMMLTRQEIGRPFVLPPGVPPAILAAYRQGFEKMAADPAFVAEMKQLNLELQPMSGVQAEKLVVGIFETPQPVVNKVKAIFAPR
jgi:tripartite-type tricarboxylate transporter receptor subunit TctC